MSDSKNSDFLAACRAVVEFDRTSTPDPEIGLAALRTRLDGGGAEVPSAIGLRQNATRNTTSGSGVRFFRLGKHTLPRRAKFPAHWTASGVWARGIVGTVALLAVGASIRFAANRVSPASDTVPPGPVYTTHTGQRASIILTDGSRVTLAPASQLRVAGNFGTSARTVSLIGEAYFDVSAGRGSPFIVQTGSTETRVLGTKFNIQHYAANAPVRVVVLTGKVMISARTSRHPSITLAAGMIGQVSDSTATAVSTNDPAQAALWANGQMVFNDAPATDVLAALTRWYGYEFSLADTAVAHKHLTVWMSTESSADALATLKQVLNVDLTFDANRVTLHPRRATTAPARRRTKLDRFSPLLSEVGR